MQNAPGSKPDLARKSILSMEKTTQTRLTVDIPAEEDDGPGLSPSQSLREQVEGILHGLEQVATNRMSAIELRSSAQEESRRIKGTLSRLGAEIRPIFETIRARLGPSLDDELTSLRQGMNSVERLLVEIATSAKAFDKTQDHVQTIEWWMMEREEELYMPYKKEGSPTLLVADFDEIASELPSAPPSQHNESEHEYLPLQRSIVDDSNVLSPGPGSMSRDATHGNSTDFTYAEILVDDYADPIIVEEPANIPLPVSNPDEDSSQHAAPALQSLRYLITPQGHERLFHYGREQNPEDTAFEGSQFNFVQEELLPDVWDSGQPHDRAAIEDSVTTHNLMCFSQWTSYGLPWRLQSRTDSGKWYPSYLLPVGRRFLRALMLNNFEATYLGISFGAKSNLLKDKKEDVQTAKAALINGWLWEPSCPVGEVDQSAITMQLFENRKHPSSIQATSNTENASHREQRRVLTTLRPRPLHHPSMSTIMPTQWYSAADSPPNRNDALSEEGANG